MKPSPLKIFEFKGQNFQSKVGHFGWALMKLQIIVVKKLIFRADFKTLEIQADAQEYF